MSNNKFSELANAVAGVGHADITTARTSTVFASVAKYRRLVGIGACATLAAGKKLTVQLMQATDAAGTGAKVLGTAKTGAALEQEVMQDANVSDMDIAGGFTFVAIKVQSDNGATHAGGGVVVMDMGRYSE